MVDNKVIRIIIMSVVTLASLGYSVVDDPTHYCEERLITAHCLSLSSTAKTCYTLPFYNGGKRCYSLWKPIGISSSPSSYDSSVSQDCIKHGGYCYCNPRGLITNRAECKT